MIVYSVSALILELYCCSKHPPQENTEQILNCTSLNCRSNEEIYRKDANFPFIDVNILQCKEKIKSKESETMRFNLMKFFVAVFAILIIGVLIFAYEEFIDAPERSNENREYIEVKEDIEKYYGYLDLDLLNKEIDRKRDDISRLEAMMDEPIDAKQKSELEYKIGNAKKSLKTLLVYKHQNQWSLLEINADEVYKSISSAEVLSSIFTILGTFFVTSFTTYLTIRHTLKSTNELQEQNHQSTQRLQEITLQAPLFQEKIQLYTSLTDKLIHIRNQCHTTIPETNHDISKVQQLLDFHFLIQKEVADKIQDFLQIARLEKDHPNFRNQIDSKLKEVRLAMQEDVQQRGNTHG